MAQLDLQLAYLEAEVQDFSHVSPPNFNRNDL